jgi:AGZA family xanthine/uracil permease-like MFS transporter
MFAFLRGSGSVVRTTLHTVPSAPVRAGLEHGGCDMATETPARPGRGPDSPSRGALDRYFEISHRGSTVRTEVIAGFATFLTMAYILFVNPSILGAVIDHDGTTLAFPRCSR